MVLSSQGQGDLSHELFDERSHYWSEACLPFSPSFLLIFDGLCYFTPTHTPLKKESVLLILLDLGLFGVLPVILLLYSAICPTCMTYLTTNLVLRQLFVTCMVCSYTRSVPFVVTLYTYSCKMLIHCVWLYIHSVLNYFYATVGYIVLLTL